MQELKHRNYSPKSLLNVKQPFFSLNSQHSFKYKVESMCNKQGAHSSLSGSKISVWNIYFANKTWTNLLISNNIFFGKKGYRVQSPHLPFCLSLFAIIMFALYLSVHQSSRQIFFSTSPLGM